MTKPNKTNFVLLLMLALLLTIACGTDNENGSTAESENKSVSETADEGASDADAEESSDDAEDEDDEETKSGPTTVKFDAGKTSKSYKNSIKRGNSHTYFLTASSGQTMSVRISSANEDAGFTVYDPSGNELSAGEETTETRDFSEELAGSGRHKIVVTSGRDVTYSIKFEVSARPKDLTAREAEGGANKIVKFGRGNSSATYSNSVVRGDRDTYILGAGAGQFMTVSIRSVENNASFEIVAPNGENLVDDDTNWTGELPRDGNYKIIIGSGRGNATYTVKFSVAQSPIRD
ncbi:MAG: hypothetical protein R2681_14305 [Pyrinomonadaceae bacterium]